MRVENYCRRHLKQYVDIDRLYSIMRRKND